MLYIQFGEDKWWAELWFHRRLRRLHWSKRPTFYCVGGNLWMGKYDRIPRERVFIKMDSNTNQCMPGDLNFKHNNSNRKAGGLPQHNHIVDWSINRLTGSSGPDPLWSKLKHRPYGRDSGKQTYLLQFWCKNIGSVVISPTK